MLHVVYFLLHIFQWCLARCRLLVVCGIAVTRIGFAARCLWSAFGCLPQCPCLRHVACCLLLVARPRARVLHGVRCPSPGPRRISSGTCCALRVVRWMLHDARSQSHVVSCPLRVQSCMPSLAGCTVDSQRRRARSASLHTHGYSQSHTVTLVTRMHARTHARMHAHLGLQQVSPATEALNCDCRRGYSRARG